MTCISANAQVLPFIPRPTEVCPVAGMALQAKRAIDAYTAADRNHVPFEDQIKDGSTATIRALEEAAAFMLASSPSGAMFQVCALLSHVENALDYMDDDAIPDGRVWLTRLQTGLKGLLQFVENEHDIDRSELSLDWYSSRHIQDRHFPAGAA